jgi:hypothetical protein
MIDDDDECVNSDKKLRRSLGGQSIRSRVVVKEQLQ